MAIKVGKGVYLAESAVLIGDVTLSDGVSLFDHAVLRGDLNSITVGENSNIQDNVTIHVERNNPTIIGKNVSIGHNAIVHGAVVEDNVIIGMGSIVMNGAKIRSGSVVAAGAVVRENFEGEENSVIAGIPATTRKVDRSVPKYAMENAESYHNLRELYLSGTIEKRWGSEKR